jgi:hypothetical protein
MHALGLSRTMCCASFLTLSGGARAATLQTSELALSSDGAPETTPSGSQDANGPLVVYTRQSTSGGPGAIWYQRFSPAAGVTWTTLVSIGSTDDELNDIDADTVVYTAFDSGLSFAGTVMLYDVSTGVHVPLAAGEAIHQARISKGKVVWLAGPGGATSLALLDIAQAGFGAVPAIIAGPVPAVGSADVGARFVVWDQIGGFGHDIMAFDLNRGVVLPVAVDPNVNERAPRTSGAWVVWQEQDAGVAATRVVALNLDTGERRVVADGASFNQAPSIDDDIIAYESNAAGNFDIYVYRLSKGDTFQVTTAPSNQRLNDVFGNNVAYVDDRPSVLTIYVSTFAIIDDPCLNLGEDVDADGICGSVDNCPVAANADQHDTDSDGVGDVCDDCAAVPNPTQVDTDRDGLGDACDVCVNDPNNPLNPDGTCQVAPPPPNPDPGPGSVTDPPPPPTPDPGPVMDPNLDLQSCVPASLHTCGSGKPQAAYLCTDVLVSIPEGLFSDEVIWWGTRSARLVLHDSRTGSYVYCHYRHDASHGRPHHKPTYLFVSCSNGMHSGDAMWTRFLSLDRDQSDGHDEDSDVSFDLRASVVPQHGRQP